MVRFSKKAKVSFSPCSPCCSCWKISHWPPSEEFWCYKASWSSLIPQAESLSLFCFPLPALQNQCKRLVIIIWKYIFLVCDNKTKIKRYGTIFLQYLPPPKYKPIFQLWGTSLLQTISLYFSVGVKCTT